MQTNVKQTMKNLKKPNFTLIFWLRFNFINSCNTDRSKEEGHLFLIFEVYSEDIHVFSSETYFLTHLSVSIFISFDMFWRCIFSWDKNQKNPSNFLFDQILYICFLFIKHFCNFSLINTMMTKQQDMLDGDGNVAGASHQGDDVKNVTIFFSIFSAP